MYKVVVAYALVAWLLIQISPPIFPVLEIPNWATKLAIVVVVPRFPLALLCACGFERGVLRSRLDSIRARLRESPISETRAALAENLRRR